jgi:RimJ/RimL family protein N-acetyltransferase
MLLETERLILREFESSDFDAVHGYASDPEVIRYMPWGPNSRSDTSDFIRLANSEARLMPRISFQLAIVERSSARCIGGIKIQVEGTTGELGYCLARSAWARGYASEGCRAVVDFGFRELALHRIWAGCDPENPASARVLEKSELQFEECLQRDTQIRGQWRDTLLYALSREEWASG